MSSKLYFKSVLILAIYFLASGCNHKDRLIEYPYDNNLVGDWKVNLQQVDSLPSGSPKDDFVIRFSENNNEVKYKYNNVEGIGHYFILSVGYGIVLKLEPKDVAQDVWFRHFIANMNEVKSYRIINETNNQVRTWMWTHQGEKISLLKL